MNLTCALSGITIFIAILRLTLFRFDSLSLLKVFHINFFFRLFRPTKIVKIISKDEFEIFVSKLVHMIGESTHSRQRATCVISSTVPARSINTEQIINFNTIGYGESSRSLRRSCRFNFDLGRLSPRRCNLGGRRARAWNTSKVTQLYPGPGYTRWDSLLSRQFSAESITQPVLSIFYQIDGFSYKRVIKIFNDHS